MASDRTFAARVHPERDPELWACIASRVDGDGKTFKAFLAEALALAYPDEFGKPPEAPLSPVVEVLPPAGTPAPTAQQPVAAAPAPATPGRAAGSFGLDARFDANLRRELR